MAGKPKTVFRCSECGWTTGKWVGRCGQCQAWGTVDEAGMTQTARTAPAAPAVGARPITEVNAESTLRSASGIAELDRVLGGGVVPGGVRSEERRVGKGGRTR